MASNRPTTRIILTRPTSTVTEHQSDVFGQIDAIYKRYRYHSDSISPMTEAEDEEVGMRQQILRTKEGHRGQAFKGMRSCSKPEWKILYLVAYGNAYVGRSRQERIFICCVLIVAIKALDGGISSTNGLVIRPPSSLLAHAHPSNMTIVSNDPGWWPVMNSARPYSYFVVASSVAVVYDWALTFGQEIELVWRQPWSLMTVLYFSIRYIGIIYVFTIMLSSLPSFSATGVSCSRILYTLILMNVVTAAILGVIMIARLHAMYQGSRKVLVFLVVAFLAVNIPCGVIAAIGIRYISGEELILYGSDQPCTYKLEYQLLGAIVWSLYTVWEILILCLAAWIAVKHFRELKRLGPSTGCLTKGFFMVLVQTHVIYFASFFAVSCFNLGYLSPTISGSSETQLFVGARQMFVLVQMFVLGPRLILGVREYHANLVADSDTGTNVIALAFQEGIHGLTGGGV